MERLRDLAAKTGILLSDEQIGQFRVYYEMLVEKNKVMNLTAITELEDVIVKHFLDSIALAGVYRELEGKTVLDLGTGAGFPGIPLKIAFPDLKVTLMDSLNKRILFLQSVIEELQLNGIIAVHGRAEEAARKKEYREQFDLCVSRAVANLATLCEYCIPFVKVGGSFISYKASDITEEVEGGSAAIQVLGGKLNRIEQITLPTTDIHRSFVFVDKIKHTSKVYPRKAGTASKTPITVR